MFPYESMFGLFARPELPIECNCGDASTQSCTQIGLRDHRNFPPFAYLPEENDVDESYYALDGGMYSPTRHWVLVGEIMEVSFFIRPRVTIKTQYGETVLVNFHLDTPSPTFFNWGDLKPKHTLAIFYAVNRTFMDMNQGVRQESARTVMVFPCPLECLMDEFEGHVSVTKSAKACFYCGKLESDDHKLLKCIRCKHVFYCGRNCQSPHWKKSHKSLCQYAPMLANLSKLAFSHFDDFVDWSFPTIVPPTAEEKTEKAKKIIREALYNMGATSTGDSMQRVDEFLSLIEGRDTSSALQLLCSDASPIMTMLNESGLPQLIRDTFLFKSLKEFTCAVMANPDLRQHVVDLKSDESGGFQSRSTHEFTSDILLSALFAVIPLWQHEECMSGISWSFESHFPLNVIQGNDAFKSNVWRMHGDTDSLLIKNRVSGSTAFMSDHMKLVAEMGEMIAAQANPCDIVIRVIRVTANESWADCVRSIATQQDLSSNVYTLWIRENVAICGSFNPLNPEMSLVEKLLDRRELSVVELLLEQLGVHEENNIMRRDSSETESQGQVGMNEQVCYSCGELKSVESFSNTQRRRYGNEARCRECVSLSTL